VEAGVVSEVSVVLVEVALAEVHLVEVLVVGLAEVHLEVEAHQAAGNVEYIIPWGQA
jgi:hypothetical protein